jgi:triosephosphate isomerase (TIM)
MRKKVIAGNWKMNKDLNESLKLVNELKVKLINIPKDVEVIICPPFTALAKIYDILKDTKISLGAQNMYFENEGAFTAEISPLMLKSVGCKYVILGHSERRIYFGETDEIINKKVKKALEHQLNPIVCVGETLAEREQNITNKIIETQVRGTLSGFTAEEISKCIIAYEPVWAIGTGKTATPEQAQEVHHFIRSIIEKLSNSQVAENIIIQYGGSMKPDNAKILLSQKDVDGGLIGGACLKADSFAGIVDPVA